MSDIRKIALELDLHKVPAWIDRWGRWVNVWELSGEERADLLQKCTEVKKNAAGKNEGKVNLKRLYPMLAILTLHEPAADVLPDPAHPHYHEYPGARDANGNYLTPPLPETEQGELVFALTDLVALNKRSGDVLERISQIASPMSGLRPEDVEEKKDSSGQPDLENGALPYPTVESDGYTIE